MGKKSLVIVAAAVAIGAPYAASEWKKHNSAGSASAVSSTAPAWGASTTGPATYPTGLSQGEIRAIGTAPMADETPIVDMAEAFRLSVNPAWVMSRWPRVSTALTEEALHGLRVTLISGMQPDDVAGALTYYFTPAQHCAKITFSGTTGDPRRFITTIIQRFGFKPYSKDEPGVMRYEIRWNGKAESELVVRPVAVVKTSSQFSRYQVQLSLTDSTAK